MADETRPSSIISFSLHDGSVMDGFRRAQLFYAYFMLRRTTVSTGRKWTIYKFTECCVAMHWELVDWPAVHVTLMYDKIENRLMGA